MATRTRRGSCRRIPSTRIRRRPRPRQCSGPCAARTRQDPGVDPGASGAQHPRDLSRRNADINGVEDQPADDHVEARVRESGVLDRSGDEPGHPSLAKHLNALDGRPRSCPETDRFGAVFLDDPAAPPSRSRARCRVRCSALGAGPELAAVRVVAAISDQLSEPRRGRPVFPRTGPAPSTKGQQPGDVVSVPPVGLMASGIPDESTIRWCLESGRPRSTGDGVKDHSNAEAIGHRRAQSYVVWRAGCAAAAATPPETDPRRNSRIGTSINGAKSREATCHDPDAERQPTRASHTAFPPADPVNR